MRFDTFELDVSLRELRRGDALVRMQAQPSEILMTLLARASRPGCIRALASHIPIRPAAGA